MSMAMSTLRVGGDVGTEIEKERKKERKTTTEGKTTPQPSQYGSDIFVQPCLGLFYFYFVVRYRCKRCRITKSEQAMLICRLHTLRAFEKQGS